MSKSHLHGSNMSFGRQGCRVELRNAAQQLPPCDAAAATATAGGSDWP